MNKTTVYTTMDSPIGPLLLTGVQSPSGLLLDTVSFNSSVLNGQCDVAAFVSVERQLKEYFAGSGSAFDIAHTERGTPFQQSVWAALEEIPYGTTISYGSLAT